jgi:hypothetical protein
MNMTDELVRLSKLHEEGALNAEEFAQAKRRLLDSPGNPPPSDSDRRLAEAANFYVTLEKAKIAIALIVFTLICFGAFLVVKAQNPRLGW